MEKKVLVKLMGDCTASNVQKTFSAEIDDTVEQSPNHVIAILDFSYSRENLTWVKNNYENVIYKQIRTEKVNSGKVFRDKAIKTGYLSTENLNEAEQFIMAGEQSGIDITMLIKVYSDDQKSEIREWLDGLGYSEHVAYIAMFKAAAGKPVVRKSTPAANEVSSQDDFI